MYWFCYLLCTSSKLLGDHAGTPSHRLKIMDRIRAWHNVRLTAKCRRNSALEDKIQNLSATLAGKSCVSPYLDDVEKDETKQTFPGILTISVRRSTPKIVRTYAIFMKPDLAFQLEVKIIFTLKKLKSVLPPLKC